MKRYRILLAAAVLLLVGAVGHAAPKVKNKIKTESGGPPPHTVARQWNDVLLDAIRIDIPKPTVHARNLFHMSVAMWDAWAAYEPSANGYLVKEKLFTADVAAARDEAISFAAYRVLKHRYRYGPGEIPSQQSFDDLMDALGYDRTFTSTDGDSPAALGNRIGQAVIDYGLSDGANEGPLLDYADDTGYATVNPELVFDLPGTFMFDPNRWQPLAFDYLILQNGIVIGAAIQEFLSPNWGKVAPFALKSEDQDYDWVYMDPGPPVELGGATDAEFKANAVQLIELSSQVDPSDGATMDISPGAIHNNPLGTHDGTGRPLNPHTGLPYEPNVVLRADYGRVIAEFWADGPDSETPPGHWNTLANYVVDHPLFERRLYGEGRVLDALEWDVKMYLALNGATHDAAIGAWGCKGHYDYSRPISHIRYMGGLGQSSDPLGPSYNPDGLPLVPDLIEVITEASTQAGQRHQHLASHVGEIAIRAWQGDPADPHNEIGGVGWIRAIEWMPYQRDTFVTPPFAGYTSGHSTFSRAAAEVMTCLTGDPFFPGGMGTFTAYAYDYLEFENGPTTDVELQWATYYDAADEAGISRLWGGIHPAVDDFPGRVMGSEIGIAACEKAGQFYGDGKVTLCHVPPGNPGNAHTISVSPNAMRAHLAHGDSTGACEGDDVSGGYVEESFPRDRTRRGFGSRFGAAAQSTAGARDGFGQNGGGPGTFGAHGGSSGEQDPPVSFGVLDQSTDLHTRYGAVVSLVDQVDPALAGVLIEHLEDIADKAKAAGMKLLAERSERLKERLESR